MSPNQHKANEENCENVRTALLNLIWLIYSFIYISPDDDLHISSRRRRFITSVLVNEESSG